MGTLVGGAIGSLITIAVAFSVRASAVPRELPSNDRRARDRNEDLRQWIADRNVALRRELATLRNELAASGIIFSGAYGGGLGRLKETALHEWRDQVRLAERDIALVYDHEGFLHEFWRATRENPQVHLTAPTEAEPILAAWRAPITKHLTANDKPQPIGDPSERRLEHAVIDTPARLDEYV
jgi:hypothetical protein